MQVAATLPGRTPQQCEELYLMHKTLLSIDGIGAKVIQGAMQDIYNNNVRDTVVMGTALFFALL